MKSQNREGLLLTSKRQIYELSPAMVGRQEQVPHVLRKGLPDEYKNLLNQAKEETYTKVDTILRKTAKMYVHRLYDILINYKYTPENAGSIIIADCISIWSKDYVRKCLPKEALVQSKRIGGKASAHVRVVRKAEKRTQVLEEIGKIYPDIKDADKETQDVAINAHKHGLAVADKETVARVATEGGKTTRDRHPEQYREMGLESAKKRWGYVQQQQTLELHIETEEHREFVKAFEKSLIARANGTGGYVIFVKDGEFSHVEPSDGNPAKTVNK